MTTTLVTPKSLRIGEVIVLIFCFILTTLAVSARTYAKIRLFKDMRAEDYLSLLAWMSFMGYVGLGIVIGNNAGGIVHTAYLSAIENTLYTIIIVIVKLSILLQYITIFTPQRRGSLYYSIHVLIWTNTVYYFITTAIYMNVCTPRRRLWDPSVPGHCISSNGFGVSSGVLNVVSDFSILALPLPLIWSLQMPTNKKISVTVVFGFGLFACITSVLRLVYSIDLLKEISGTLNFQITEDKIGLLSFAEIAIGIIVGCSPVLPRFFKNLSIKNHKMSGKFRLISSGSSPKIWFSRYHRSNTTDPEKNVTQSSSQSFYSSQKSEPPRIATLNFPHDSFPSRVSVFDEPLPSQGDMENGSRTRPEMLSKGRDQSYLDLDSIMTQNQEQQTVSEDNIRQGREIMKTIRIESTIRPASKVYTPNSSWGSSLVPNSD